MKKIILIVCILAAAALSIAIISFYKKQKNTSQFETVTVKKKNIGSSILATGSVKPIIGAEVKAGPRISGKVEHLYANIGDRVEKDQVIAEIEKKDLEAQVAQHQAAIALNEAKLSALENQRPKAIAIALSNIESAKSLMSPQLAGVVSSNYGGITNDFKANALAGIQVSFPLYNSFNNTSVKKAKNELDLTETTFNDNRGIIQAELDQAKAELELSKVQLSYATIKAPISGVIASVTTQEGETVASGLTAPTFVTIIDLARLQVDAFVDETDIGRVKVGQKALFTVDTYPDKEFEGVVSAIYPKAIIQENVVNYDVVINITSPFKGLLRPDMTTSVTIYQEEKKGLLMVPRKAVKKEGDSEFVFVKTQEGTLLKKEVKTGLRHRDDIEIVSGLKEGDAVVTATNEAEKYKD